MGVIISECKEQTRCSIAVQSVLTRLLWRQVNDFDSLPSRAKWPDYYSTIAKPICIRDIFQKTQNYEYESVEDAVQDWELLTRNAQVVRS